MKKKISKLISNILNIMLIFTCIILAWVYREHVPVLIPSAVALLGMFMGVVSKGNADKLKYDIHTTETKIKVGDDVSNEK